MKYFTQLKAALFFASLLPLLRLGWLGYFSQLGANPIEFITRSLGTWTLVFLLLTLCVTPLRHLSGWLWLIKLRRMVGLFAFFYALLHFITYIWLDQFFDLNAMVKDVIKRPFITIGFAAFILLLPLAITSNNAMIKKLGGKNWQRIHRLIYIIAILAVLHYWWLVKKDVSQPLVYAVLLGVLLAYRIWFALSKRRAKRTD